MCCVQSSQQWARLPMRLLSTLLQEDGPIVITGDFNIFDINWSTICASSEFSCNLCDLIFECNLTQHIEHATHVQGHTLDLILMTTLLNL